MNKIYVFCCVCGKKYEAKIPKGGDGGLLVPRKHKIVISTNSVAMNGTPIYKKETRSGSWREGFDF